MNTKIKQLAEQAWDSLIDEMGDVVSKDGRLNWDFLHAYDQRFAELIVQECIAKVEMRKKFAIEDQHIVDHAFDLLVYDLESHFGVE